MADPETQKPSHEEWQRWAQVVLDRLTTCVHVFSHPPYDDVFMAEKERQEKNTLTLDLLRRVHALIDDAETPTDSLADVAHHDERVIAGLKVLMQETLSRLPALSIDMQKLLKSSWHDKCNGRLAGELFKGPMGNEVEGIGSGHPEHGRLPEILRDLIEREQLGDGRQPREALHRHGGGKGTGERGGGPERHVPDARRRWADGNKKRWQSAGQVD